MLQASGNLKDIERKLNQTVAKVAQCQYVAVVAFYDPGSWYLTAGGTRHPVQVRIGALFARVHAVLKLGVVVSLGLKIVSSCLDR